MVGRKIHLALFLLHLLAYSVCRHRILLPFLPLPYLRGFDSPRAGAVPLTYEMGAESTVTGNFSDPGLVVKYALVTGLQDVAFSLHDGQSYTFDLLRYGLTKQMSPFGKIQPRSTSQ